MSALAARLGIFVALALVGAAANAGDDTDPHARHKQMMGEQMAHEADPHAKHKKMIHDKGAMPSDSSIEIPDVQLLTQDGDTVSLRDDVIGHKIVVIDFVYTTCTTVCPVLSAILGQLQGRLGDRLGDEVVIISLTVDPLRDTPQRLKAYAAKHHALDGWVWLTGDKQAVDRVLKEFGAYTANFEDHPSMMLVGDNQSGEWSRFLGFPGSGKIMQKINEISAARGAMSAVME